MAELMLKSKKKETTKAVAVTPAQNQRPLMRETAVQRTAVSLNNPTPAQISYLQRTMGNQAVRRAVQRPIIQRKMTLGPAGDKYEDEADSVAKQVVQNLGSPQSQPMQRQEEDDELQMKPLQTVAISPLQRQEEEDDELQAKGDSTLEGGELSGDVETAVSSAKSGGSPLSDNVRAPMEQAFNADFSSVKVHTGGESDSLNRSLSARAFTSGSDIFFRNGEYNPGNSGGKELLAHELTHTVQQGATQVKRKEMHEFKHSPEPTIQRSFTSWKRGVKVGGKGAFSRAGKSMSKGWSNLTNQTHTQKAGKTLDEIINPTIPISRALRQHMRVNNAWETLNFVRDYYRLVTNPDHSEEILYNDVSDFMRKYATVIADPELVDQYRSGRPLRMISDAQKQAGITRTKPFMALIQDTLTQGENSLRPHVDSYNTQHGRQAAPNPVPPAPQTDSDIFQQHGVQQTQFTTANLTSREELGSGAVNTVYQHEYQDQEDPYVFKGDEDVNAAYGKDSATQVGIPEENPQFMKRSVAMYKIDQLLGANIITKTHFAVQDGQFGIVSEMAKGKARIDLSNEEREHIDTDPVYQKALSRLQLIDVITGQLDRHAGNYFIETNEDSGDFVAIKGIDNDMAFGTDHTDIWQKIGKGYYRNTDGEMVMKSGPKMGGSTHIEKIGTIDEAFAQRILNLDSATVRDALQGLLTDGEITATITRIDQLKVFLRDAINREVSIALSYLDPDAEPGEGELNETEDNANVLMVAYATFKRNEEWTEALTILQQLKQRSGHLQQSDKTDDNDLANINRLNQEIDFINKKLLLPDLPDNQVSSVTVDSSAGEASVLWSGIKPQLVEKNDKDVVARMWTQGTQSTKTKILAAMGASSGQLKMSKLQYVLEAIDEQHRMTLKGKAEEWFKANDNGDFFAWLQSHGSEGPGMTVQYAEAEAREAMRVQFDNGELHQATEEDVKPMNTGSGHGWAIVLSNDDQFYSAPKSASTESQNLTKHSTFLKGIPVETAGRMNASNGKLSFFENYSGHYNPELRHLIKMYYAFKARGVEMDETEIQYLIGPRKIGKITGVGFIDQVKEWATM